MQSHVACVEKAMEIFPLQTKSISLHRIGSYGYMNYVNLFRFACGFSGRLLHTWLPLPEPCRPHGFDAHSWDQQLQASSLIARATCVPKLSLPSSTIGYALQRLLPMRGDPNARCTFIIDEFFGIIIPPSDLAFSTTGEACRRNAEKSCCSHCPCWHKRAHLNTAQECQSQGITFRPIIVESTGAWEPEAAHLLKAVAYPATNPSWSRAGAVREHRTASVLHSHFLQELCVTVRSYRGRAALSRRSELVSSLLPFWPPCDRHSCSLRRQMMLMTLDDV
jgi:hypothetical protein